MKDEQIYLFDLQGYIVLKGVVPADVLAAANAALDRFEQMDPADYPPPLQLGDRRTDNNLFISNILEGDAAFRPLIDLPDVVDVVSTVTGGPYRLNHTPKRSRTVRSSILPGARGEPYITAIAQDICLTGAVSICASAPLSTTDSARLSRR